MEAKIKSMKQNAFRRITPLPWGKKRAFPHVKPAVLNSSVPPVIESPASLARIIINRYQKKQVCGSGPCSQYYLVPASFIEAIASSDTPKIETEKPKEDKA